MSLNITKSYGTCWDLVVEDKYVRCNLSTSKKIQRTDAETGDVKVEYERMSWHARFVGNAFESAKELSDRDRIIINSAKIENHYDKEAKKLYVTLVIFDFEKQEPTTPVESSDAE